MQRPKSFPVARCIMLLAAVPFLYACTMKMRSTSTPPGFGQSTQREVTPVSRASQSAIGQSSSAEAEVGVFGTWPPRKGARYPDLVLNDQNGTPVRLSDFAGRPILVELAAVSCAGCQALAGGNDVGGFLRVRPQKSVSSIHKSAERYANVRLGRDREVVFVQLLLYGKKFGSPTDKEVSGWAKHFGTRRSDCSAVLQSTPDMLSMATYHMIPGFHLIDEDFVLTHDSAGHSPADNLYTDLLPALGKMANGTKKPNAVAPKSNGVQMNSFMD